MSTFHIAGTPNYCFFPGYDNRAFSMPASLVAGPGSCLAGRANFTGLDHWGPNQAPGDAGTGTSWLDGDLGYSISVRGNTFRETGGDQGRLTGVFVGGNHEGVTGTLERTDLTAAFGASR